MSGILTTILAAEPIPENTFGIPWDMLTENKFLLEIISIPIFSAFAGLLTNWTGVLMLFAPVYFTGFYVPGLKNLFPFLPRKIQILPIFAPGGILGFQGFIPARAEKMASICCDKAVARIGNIKDFFNELDPEGIADYVAKVAGPQIRPLVDDVVSKQNPELWKNLTPQLKEVIYQRVEAELPRLCRRAFEEIGDNVDQLIDIKLLMVGFLRENPLVLKEVVYGLAAPELRLMIKSGLLGAPLGAILAIYLHFYPSIPILNLIPAWLVVLFSASMIGIIVNIIAIKMVFEPGDPQPRYKYLWKQAMLAKRQEEAAGDFGHAIAYQILTIPNVANELLAGPRGDKTMRLVETVLADEMDRILGPVRSLIRVAVGSREYEGIQADAGRTALQFKETLVEDAEFAKVQSEKIDKFASQKLRELRPAEFMEMLYAAIEQDAWLLYLHGGLLGVIVGAAHVLLFGA